MKIDGGCYCGSITYEAEVDPEKVEICHCTDCQVFGGSAFRIYALVEGDKFKLLSGQPTRYIKTAEDGTKSARMFCPECGTAVFASAIEGEPRTYVSVATARQRNELPPKTQYWVRSAQHWLTELNSLPRVETQ
jgi:hypothetical protein